MLPQCSINLYFEKKEKRYFNQSLHDVVVEVHTTENERPKVSVRLVVRSRSCTRFGSDRVVAPAARSCGFMEEDHEPWSVEPRDEPVRQDVEPKLLRISFEDMCALLTASVLL